MSEKDTTLGNQDRAEAKSERAAKAWAAREAEIRRPGRKIETLTDAQLRARDEPLVLQRATENSAIVIKDNIADMLRDRFWTENKIDSTDAMMHPFDASKHPTDFQYYCWKRAGGNIGIAVRDYLRRGLMMGKPIKSMMIYPLSDVKSDEKANEFWDEIHQAAKNKVARLDTGIESEIAWYQVFGTDKFERADVIAQHDESERYAKIQKCASELVADELWPKCKIAIAYSWVMIYPDTDEGTTSD